MKSALVFATLWVPASAFMTTSPSTPLLLAARHRPSVAKSASVAVDQQALQLPSQPTRMPRARRAATAAAAGLAAAAVVGLVTAQPAFAAQVAADPEHLHLGQKVANVSGGQPPHTSEHEVVGCRVFSILQLA
jgi:hypothetical protein